MPNFTCERDRNWTIDEGSFGEPVVGFFDDGGNFISLAHIAIVDGNKREVEANTRLFLHAPDMYFLLQKIILTRKCIVSEVRDLLRRIDGDEVLMAPSVPETQSDDADNENGED